MENRLSETRFAPTYPYLRLRTFHYAACCQCPDDIDIVVCHWMKIVFMDGGCLSDGLDGARAGIGLQWGCAGRRTNLNLNANGDQKCSPLDGRTCLKLDMRKRLGPANPSLLSSDFSPSLIQDLYATASSSCYIVITTKEAAGSTYVLLWKTPPHALATFVDVSLLAVVVTLIKVCHHRPIVFTDGACLNNGHDDARSGIGVALGTSESDQVSFPVSDLEGTLGSKRANQKAELLAALEGLKRLSLLYEARAEHRKERSKSEDRPQ
ncbi:hypothetical protein L218DRAFT_992598 [Marasmius fiardii PR-910]|nr:hypothetical protein L218DRAFT_992598 [Marasmius fiardii PR-910]